MEEARRITDTRCFYVCSYSSSHSYFMFFCRGRGLVIIFYLGSMRGHWASYAV